MTFLQILRLPLTLIPAHKLLAAGLILALLAATLYPSDMDAYRAAPYAGAEQPVIVLHEEYGRHLNTAVALGRNTGAA